MNNRVGDQNDASGYRKMIRRTSILVLTVVLLAACSAGPTPPPAPASPVRPTLAATTETSPTSIPTQTPIPTSTPTPTVTPTPTLALPLLAGASLPENAPVIAPNNVSKIREIARWGKGAINGIAWSPDGKYLALATELGLYLYDSETFKDVQFIDAGIPTYYDLDFSPDGSMLATAKCNPGKEGSIEVWAFDGNKLKKKVGFNHAECVRSVSFSRDSLRIASGSSDGKVRIWAINGGQPQVLEELTWRYDNVSYSPDGQYLAAKGTGRPGNASAWQDTLLLLNTEDGSLVRELKGHERYLYQIAFSGDGGILAAGTTNNTVPIWSIPGGSFIKTLTGHKGHVTSVAASPNGEFLASGGFDPTVRLWSLPTGKLLYTLEGHTDQIVGITFAPDSQSVATASWDGTVRIWSTSDGSLKRTLDGHPGPYGNIDFSSDGKLLATVSQLRMSGQEYISQNQTVHLLDARSGKEIHAVQIDDNESVFKAVFSANGQSLAMHTSRVIQVMNVSDWNSKLTYKTAKIRDIAISPDGAYVAYSTERNVRLLRTSDGKIMAQMESNSRDTAGFIDFSPNGQRIAGNVGCRILVWDANTGKLTVQLEAIKGRTKFTPDGQFFGIIPSPTFAQWGAWSCVSSKKGTTLIEKLTFIRAEDGEMVWTQSMDKETGLIAFSPNGQIMATTKKSSNEIFLRKLSSGENMYVFIGQIAPHKGIRSLAFTPDGKYLVTASLDGTIRLWGIP